MMVRSRRAGVSPASPGPSPWDAKAPGVQAYFSHFMVNVSGTPTLLEALEN